MRLQYVQGECSDLVMYIAYLLQGIIEAQVRNRLSPALHTATLFYHFFQMCLSYWLPVVTVSFAEKEAWIFDRTK